MEKDGLYMSHGPEGRVLAVIREGNGQTVWIRNFATKESVLDILEEEVLQGHERSAISDYLSSKKGFYTDNFETPEGGFRSHAFMKYVLSS
jgi:hypothetical protein